MSPRREVWPALPDAAALAVYRVAAGLWARNLWKSAGYDALAYLRGRGIPDGVIRQEGIGFATDTLAGELEQRGLSLETAQRLGLLRPNGHETFNGRVVLWEWRRVAGTWTPVWATARTCAAGASWDDVPKYLNVRGDRLLGGLERALGYREVALVEGAFDRLALLSFGEAAVFLGSNDPPEGVLGEVRRLARRAVLYLVRDR